MFLLDTQNSTAINWQSVAITLLASIITTVITMWVTLKTKKTDFDYNYKKYILDRRLKAYEEAEKIIAQLFPTSKVVSKELLEKFKIESFHSFLTIDENGWQTVNKRISSFRETMVEYRAWYSSNFVIKWHAINKILFDISEEVQTATELDYYTVVFKHKKDLRTSIKNFQNQFYLDIVTLNDINSFFKDRRLFVNPFNFSLSGMKNYIIHYINQPVTPKSILRVFAGIYLLVAPPIFLIIILYYILSHFFNIHILSFSYK